MPNEVLRKLVENLNVNNVKGEMDAYFDSSKNDDVFCTSDDKNYIASLTKGMKQHFGITLEIKSEDKLKTTQTMFQPTEQFHYIQISKPDLLKLCDKFKVSYEDVKKGDAVYTAINLNLRNKPI